MFCSVFLMLSVNPRGERAGFMTVFLFLFTLRFNQNRVRTGSSLRSSAETETLSLSSILTFNHTAVIVPVHQHQTEVSWLLPDLHPVDL